MPRLPLQRLRTLVLNADYHPISITSAYRSVSLCRARQAFALEMDPTATLVSEKDSVECPAVIVLTEYRKLTPASQRAAPMKREIMHRDQATCQYCGAVATTIDHVLPRSRGGGSTFDNLVACCAPCNRRKSNRLLAETQMRLSRPPEKPEASRLTWSRLQAQRLAMFRWAPAAQRPAWARWLLGGAEDPEAEAEAEAEGGAGRVEREVPLYS